MFMNGADWRQYFSYRNFEKKTDSQKSKPLFYISDQKIVPKTANTH